MLTRRAGRPGARRSTLTRARTVVDRRSPIRLSPPLRGGELGVVGCCGSASAHRHGVLERDGRLSFPQRYAIDVVRVADPLRSFAGDPNSNASYFVHGEEVLAAAPGRVAAVRDGAPENTPPHTAPGVTTEGAAGNYVTQNLGGGRFALYAHLQPGSLRVRPGDQVQRGQVLGLVGNSGNSTEPHLHFHVDEVGEQEETDLGASVGGDDPSDARRGGSGGGEHGWNLFAAMPLDGRDGTRIDGGDPPPARCGYLYRRTVAGPSARPVSPSKSRRPSG
ncbi:MAG: M23 family metallopeptidase, partial [Solirubrobacterales bacterium]|nr:M23 family metallopeptidase [Solirubrobacterales bacterium]